MHDFSRTLFSFAAAAALTTLGCGSGEDTLGAPVAPSAIATPAATVNDARLEVAVLDAGVSAATDVSVKCDPTPPPGYKVTVLGTSITTVTNDDGVVYLSDLPPGSITLHFSSPGVDAQLKITGLVNGKTLFLKVKVDGNTIVIVSSKWQ